MTAASVEGSSVASAMGETVETVSEVPPDNSTVHVKRAASDDRTPEMVFPEWSGEIRIRTRETEQVEVRLASQFDDSEASYEGYVVMNGRMRPLPVGSTLNRTSGTFSWQPGPGFVGRYEFVFLRTGSKASRHASPSTSGSRPRPKATIDDRSLGSGLRAQGRAAIRLRSACLSLSPEP